MIPLPIQKQMIEDFQCPGCVCGSNIECEAFKFTQDEGFFRCDGHVPGTIMVIPGHGMQTIILGLPKGFCRIGPSTESKITKMRLWKKGAKPEWDKFNVPVWALEKDGYLFVRTYMPRINFPLIDVIEEGTLDICPGAVNVSEFYEEMD